MEAGLPFADYQARPGLNQSTLRQRLASSAPGASGHRLAMEAGNAGHCLLLEPERFYAEYHRAPDGLRPRGTQGQRRWRELEQQTGKTLLRANLWDGLHRAQQAIEAHPHARHLLETAITELSLFWEQDGLACKARLDGWAPEAQVVFDLKFTGSVTAQDLPHLFAGRHLDLQAAWYGAGIQHLTGHRPQFVLIVVERFAPHRLLVHSLTPAELASGLKKINSALAL